jgi:hypothetical protein
MAASLALLLFISTVFSISTHVTKYRPAVLMHGIKSTADDMNELAGWLIIDLPGIYAVLIEIDNGVDDSFLMPTNKQIELFCASIVGDIHLRQGFNMLRISQRSLIVREAAERCSLPVYNLITFSGLHQGIFGVPKLQMLPVGFRQLITKFAYDLVHSHR